MKLKENDFVVVVGSTKDKSGESVRHHALATVVAVGMKDVFLQFDERRSVHRMPADRCIRIEDSNVMSSGNIIIPKIGDLVVSVNERFGKVEKNMGVLVEISEIPGKAKTAKILQGETSNIVLLDSLIVLE